MECEARKIIALNMVIIKYIHKTITLITGKINRTRSERVSE